MKKYVLLASAMCLTLVACEKQETKSKKEAQEEQMDRRAREDRRVSLLDQYNSDNDRMITQRIRQILESDNTLATSARNITIITNNGNVRLQGYVNNEREKNQIANKVRQISGVNSIENRLEISSAQTTSTRY